MAATAFEASKGISIRRAAAVRHVDDGQGAEEDLAM